MAGLSGSVPYGVAGSVSVTAAWGVCDVAVAAGAGWVAALAMGASATAAPIAAAANHGTAYLMVFMVFSRWCGCLRTARPIDRSWCWPRRGPKRGSRTRTGCGDPCHTAREDRCRRWRGQWGVPDG